MPLEYNQLLNEQVAKLKYLLPCCPNCLNFDHALEGCRLADLARPPARVIAFGCSAFDQDIPF